MSFVPELLDHNIKVIDLSADFRFRNVAVYEKHYQPHTAGNLSEKAVYGLSEINTEMIRNAALVGNPGCYPTSMLLPLIPLIKNKLVKTNSIIVDAKSGVSGAGRSVSLGTHFCEVNESFKAYKVADHRHIPRNGRKPEYRRPDAGSDYVCTASCSHDKGDVDYHICRTVPNRRWYGYSGTPEIILSGSIFCPNLQKGTFPDVSNVRTTNFCDIGLKVDQRNNRIVLVSAIDNLVKGAAGQAVQNMNLMMGLDEKTGLDAAPFPV